MIFEFRGLNRHVLTHEHKLNPGMYYRNKEIGAPLEWENSTTAYGTLYNLSLSGNFIVEIDFQIQELRNWLKKYVEEEPESALKLLSRMQAHAIIQLSKKTSSDEEVSKT